MKIKGPIWIAALAALLLLYFLRRANASQVSTQATPAGLQISGAPVADYGTALAQQQTGLLQSILSSLTGGGIVSSSTLASSGASGSGSSSSSGTATGTNPGPALGPGQVGPWARPNQLSGADLASQERTAGAAFLTGLQYAQQQDPNVQGPLNLRASSGFNSTGYQELATLDALSSAGAGGAGSQTQEEQYLF